MTSRREGDGGGKKSQGVGKERPITKKTDLFLEVKRGELNVINIFDS